MKIYDTIVRPLTTEKSSRAQEKGRYSFIVKRSATKVDIKHAVKALYGADVVDVKTMVAPEKIRMIRGRYPSAKRAVMKKAIIKLKDKQTIDPNKIKEAKK